MFINKLEIRRNDSKHSHVSTRVLRDALVSHNKWNWNRFSASGGRTLQQAIGSRATASDRALI